MSELDVCIGDEVLLTNQLIGTVEFIGHLHDYTKMDTIVPNINEDENEDENDKTNENDEEKYDIKYGILLNLTKYQKYPLCLDKTRTCKYGKINNIQRIPIELFNIDNMNIYFESVFIGIENIKYVKRKKHNFRIKINEEYTIPHSFGSIYSGCITKLKYAGYLCSHKAKTHDNICDYNEYILNNGLLQNYYIGFLINKQCKHMIQWSWGAKHPKKRWCRLYPDDSRRYIYHKFSASLDSIQANPNDDIVIFMNLYELITMVNDTKYIDNNYNNNKNDLYLYNFRRIIALYFNKMKTLPKLYCNEKLTFKTLIESVLLRYWKCITYKQNINDINLIIIDYIDIYFRDDILIKKSNIITELYECGFIDKLLTNNYGIDKLTVIDNITLRELIYKNEKCLLFPWIEGHVFNTKLWIKTQWNNRDSYRAIIPAFKLKMQGSTNIKDEFGDGEIKYRCGIRDNLLVIIYRFKSITILLLWKPKNNKIIETGKRGFSLALQNIQLRKVTNVKYNKGKKKKSGKKNNNNEEKKDNDEEKDEKYPTNRYQVFQFVLETIFMPMNKYF
eukprot:319980_1